jgi:hypothetical protein
MSKERYNQIIDEVHKKYVNETTFDSNPKWLEPVSVRNMETGEVSMGARQYSKESFIRECKNNRKFSEKWGLEIEERDLSLEERRKIANYESEFISPMTVESWDKRNISTKLITLTYQDEKIEVYE